VHAPEKKYPEAITAHLGINVYPARQKLRNNVTVQVARILFAAKEKARSIL